MKLFHQIVTTINQLLFLGMSQPSPVWDLLHTWLLPAPGPGRGLERTTRTGPSGEWPPSARLASDKVTTLRNFAGSQQFRMRTLYQSEWLAGAGKWRREEGASQGSELLWAQARHWDTPLIDLTSRHNVYWRRITRADCMETFHEIRLLNIIPGTFIKNNLWLWNISTRAVLQTTNKHSWCAIFCVSPLRFPPFSTLVSLHKKPILVSYFWFNVESYFCWTECFFIYHGFV